MSTPVLEIGCSACGKPLGNLEFFCPNCGAKMKNVPRADNLVPRLRELHGIAIAAIAQATAHIANGRKLGIQMQGPVSLLDRAREAMSASRFAVALELASRCDEVVEDLLVQFEALQYRLEKAHRVIAIAREDGADLTEALDLLEMAEEATLAGDYKAALRYAVKCVRDVEEKRSHCRAWKVEIGDWL